MIMSERKPIYRMSDGGSCPRVLGAIMLRYDPIPETEDAKIMLKHASRCEALAASQMLDEGYRIEPSSQCQICLDRYGVERDGIHVEIDTTLFLLLGHLDRRLVLDNDRRLPVEIKSLGRFSWQSFKEYEFERYPGYAGQEACYLRAENSPGIYWVMNRDNGQRLKYIVNDFNNEINLDGFKKITLPITYDEIEDKLNAVYIATLDNILPEATYSEDSNECRWCRYRYLCAKPEPETKVKVETLSTLTEAAQLYVEGYNYRKMSEERLEQAKEVLIGHARENKIDKYKALNVSVSYRGTRTKVWLDEKTIREEASTELIIKATRESKPYDDCSIRILKEKE